MTDLTTRIITPADDFDLISLADLKVLLDIPSADTTNDAQLQMLISQNSAAIAEQCNRVFASETLVETWRCVAPVCCPDGMCRLWLTHAPVTEITSVETPKGTVIDPASYEVDTQTGKLLLLGGCSSEIVVTYTGGYDLPEESPLPLQQVTSLMVRSFRTEAAAAATGGSGIRMLAHKESRVMYFSPKDMAANGGTTGSSGGSMSDATIKNMLSKYTRYWI